MPTKPDSLGTADDASVSDGAGGGDRVGFADDTLVRGEAGCSDDTIVGDGFARSPAGLAALRLAMQAMISDETVVGDASAPGAEGAAEVRIHSDSGPLRASDSPHGLAGSTGSAGSTDARDGEDAPEPEPGDRIGEHFEIVRRIGRGGMGSVYLGRDLQLGRRVAIKVMRLQGRDRAARERLANLFDSEARATARMNHPNVVTIHQVGRWRGMPYLVLELLDGDALSDRLGSDPVPPQEAVRIMLDICRALTHAHELGLIHRDLKPQNVFMTDDGQIKVVDFGLATFDPGRIRRSSSARRDRETMQVKKESEDSQVAGSPAYMAPEQWRAAAQDGRTDLWACGVLLFQMLSGGLPFARPMDVVGDGEIPRVAAALPSVPAALDAIVARCMQRDMGARYQSARELQDALLGWESSVRRGLAGEPYRYLEAFGEADAGWFFGRDRETAQLAQMVEARALVALVGSSGAGKSSLVRAGLIGRLRERGQSWLSTAMVPGRAPLATLATRLREIAGETVDVLGGDADLRERPGFVGEVLRAHARKHGVRIALVVDQFEELFTHAIPRAERIAFAAALLSAADDPAGPVRVIATMRDDFLGHLAELPDLRDAIVGNLLALGPPDAEAMRAALLGPAEELGFRFEDGLAEVMLLELKNEAAPLPLLQFAASRLWEARDRERRLLTFAALEAMGGVAGVLASHAESIAVGLDDADLSIARELLCALVTPAGTRKTADRNELIARTGDPERAAAVLDRLVSGRLLTVARGGGQQTVALAHESLIARWHRLQAWMNVDHDRHALRERVAEAARHWRDADTPREMLWGGEPLVRAMSLLGDDRGLLGDERTFLDASWRMERRRRNLRRTGLTAIVVSALAVALGSWMAMLELRRSTAEARSSQSTAVAAAEVARLAESKARVEARHAEEARIEGFARVLAAWSLSKADDNAMLALLLACEAAAMRPGPTTLDALHHAITASLERQVLRPGSAVQHVRWLGDGGVLTVDGDAGVKRFDADGKLDASYSRAGRAMAVAMVEDGGLWSGGSDGAVTYHDRDGKAGQRLENTAPLTALTVWATAQNKGVAATSRDGHLRIWTTAPSDAQPSDAQLIDVVAHTGESSGIYWIDGAERFVTTGTDGDVRRWRVDGRADGVLCHHNDAVTVVASDLAGEVIVSGSLNGTVGLWRSGRSTRILGGHDGWVTAVAVSHDGALIASGSNDETIRLWRGDGTFLTRIAGHDYSIATLAFAPADDRLLSVSLDGTAAIWASDGARLARLTGHERPLLDGAWRADGNAVLTASEDGTARIWATRGSERRVVGGDACTLGEAALTPSAEHLLAFGEGDLFDPCPAGPALWLDVASGRALYTSARSSAITTAAAGDDAHFALGYRDGVVVVYDGDAKPIAERKFSGEITRIAAASSLFALASSTGAIALLDANAASKAAIKLNGAVLGLAVCGEFAAAYDSEGTVAWLSAAGPTRTFAPVPGRRPTAIACTVDGTRILLGFDDGNVASITTDDGVRLPVGDILDERVTALAILDVGDTDVTVISAGPSGEIAAFSLAGDTQWRTTVPGGAVSALHVHRDSGVVVVLGGDGQAHAYYDDGRPYADISSPDGPATMMTVASGVADIAMVVRGKGVAITSLLAPRLLSFAKTRASRALRPAERLSVGLSAEPGGRAAKPRVPAGSATDAFGK